MTILHMILVQYFRAGGWMDEQLVITYCALAKGPPTGEAGTCNKLSGVALISTNATAIHLRVRPWSFCARSYGLLLRAPLWAPQ